MSNEHKLSKKRKFKVKSKQLNLIDINTRIENEFCEATINKLTDERLMPRYKESNSVKKIIDKFNSILKKNEINEEKRNKIIDEFLPDIIPAGTKGAIRGNQFNKIVENFIVNLQLDKDKFDIDFEKKCDGHNTNEKPDWFIKEKLSKKTIIGMNQIDLWTGGAQNNRGSKYLINNINNNEKCKLLCVVCNKTQFKTSRSKSFNFFKVGFENNTLCYLNNLQNIIYSFFNLN